MHKKIYTCSQDLSADTLGDVLRFAKAREMKMTLVAREDVTSDVCKGIINDLSPYIEASSYLNEWSGTKLIGHAARVYRLRIADGLIDYLRRLGRPIYNYLEPEMLEDPCITRADGSEFFTAISHERDSYFMLSRDEKGELAREIPALRMRAD
ncbi:MAG: hypothetical protein AB1725_06700 [Armatimonadota bacterium]